MIKSVGKRLSFSAAILCLIFLFTLTLLSPSALAAPAASSLPREVIPGGELFGIRMESRGLIVTDFGEVSTPKGKRSPAGEAGLEKGDLILAADGIPLEGAASLAKIVSKSGGRPILLSLEREGKHLELSLTPALSADAGGWKAGLWVRDGAAGIGTVTFTVPESGAFGGLGHPVCDPESGRIFPLKEGLICTAGLDRIQKGEAGKPGEIVGFLGRDILGKLRDNGPCGVFGNFTPGHQSGAKPVPVGEKTELCCGKATVLCTVDLQGKKEYEIEIEELLGLDKPNKNFIVHVTSPELLEKTGGIVQGMSGSPILQNGKLIGAVTHVLVDDPTRGYGIFIENMLKAAEKNK
ncbi:MAG: SpoIVB peptidase [Clostridia bacterium]|nr:SpoIVB peptidase [Clostridia bacterium]